MHTGHGMNKVCTQITLSQHGQRVHAGRIIHGVHTGHSMNNVCTHHSIHSVHTRAQVTAYIYRGHCTQYMCTRVTVCTVCIYGSKHTHSVYVSHDLCSVHTRVVAYTTCTQGSHRFEVHSYTYKQHTQYVYTWAAAHLIDHHERSTVCLVTW